MCSSWSARICFVSKRRRPISVDLPSSTEPAVTSRRSCVLARLEVSDTFPVLHRCLADTVVCARLAALGHTRCGDLRHDLLERARVADDAARARHVADGAEADGRLERRLVREQL